MGKVDKKVGKKSIPSSLSNVFSFSWLSKLKRRPSPAPTRKPPSTPPAPPTNSSRSSPDPTPMSSITNLAYSPEVYDKRTGRSVAGFVEPEEDFWRFSFRRQSFEWDRAMPAAGAGDDSRPARRAFSVDFESPATSRPNASNIDRICTVPTKTEPPSRPLPAKTEHPPPPATVMASFPPLNLKRTQHQRFSKESKEVSRRPRKWAGPRSPARSGELFSPRTVCKIRAVEEMRRRKTRSKKKAGTKGGGALLEGFAVVTSSWDPQKDFRESMVEMISEKKMGDGEELEELLACYLELNHTEFHELIVKVFRQVWFDLNRDFALAASELEQGYFDY